MALGDAHSVVLPIGPGYVLSTGPQSEHLGRPSSGVDELNTVQICAVRLYVCTRTGSALRPFITRQS